MIIITSTYLDFYSCVVYLPTSGRDIIMEDLIDLTVTQHAAGIAEILNCWFFVTGSFLCIYFYFLGRYTRNIIMQCV